MQFSNSIQIVEVSCPFCQSSDRKVLQANLIDVEDGITGRYTIAECLKCQLRYLFVTPSPDSLVHCYIRDYHVRSIKRLRWLPKRLYRLRSELRYRKLRHYLRERVPSALLEIGCGSGEFLSLLENKWRSATKLYGFDIDVDRIDRPENSRIQILCEPWEQYFQPEQLDAVVLFNSLEHFSDPLALLRKVIIFLRPEGRIFGVVPNADSLWSRVFPRHWAGLQVPRHQIFFQRQTLRVMLEAAGFRNCEIHLGYDPGDLSLSLGNWLSDVLNLGTPARQSPLFLPLTVFLAPLVWLQVHLFGSSGQIEFVASK